MPVKVFVPNQYESPEPGAAFPSNDEFSTGLISLLSDGNPETGIKIQESIPHTFGFTNWDVVDPYIALSNFTFEIDVSANASKLDGSLTINVLGESFTDDMSGIDFTQEVQLNNTYFFNPIPSGLSVVFMPPSTAEFFNSVSIRVQTNIEELHISAIRKNLTSNLGGKVTVSEGYVLGRQGKISI